MQMQRARLDNISMVFLPRLSMRILRSFLRLAGTMVLVLPLLSGCDKSAAGVNDHLRRGDVALAEGHYALALSAYAHAHELAPTDMRVQRAQMRGRVYLMANQPARVAREALEDMTYEANLLRETEPGLEAICLTALGQIAARYGDIAGAKNKFQEAIKADGQSPLPHIALGMVALGEPDGLTTAKIEFDLALQRKPDAVGALVGLGQVKLAEGDLAGAIEKLEAVAHREDDFTIRLALGTARLRQGKHTEAARELRRAVAFDPKNPDARSALGQALLGLGQLEEAEEMLSAALQSRWDGSTAIALGFTLVKLGQAERALNVLGPVLTRDPLAAPALLASGMAHERLGHTSEALTHYRRILAIPAEGPQKSSILDLQKEARDRIQALAPEPAAPTSSASAATPPSTVSPPSLPPTQPPGKDPLGGRN
jgi:tetratricopeptide (TPR) repeat protein